MHKGIIITRGVKIRKRIRRRTHRIIRNPFSLLRTNAMNNKSDDVRARCTLYSSMVSELRFHIRQNNALILGNSCLYGDYSRDMVAIMQDRLKQGATNNNDTASKLRERVYNAFKLAGYEEDSDGDTFVILTNRIDSSAPEIMFEYKYHAADGQKKVPVICLKDVHRSMVACESEYYKFVSNHIATTLEAFPDIFNCIYIQLYVIPSLSVSKKLARAHVARNLSKLGIGHQCNVVKQSEEQ